jgi:TatA/E family protein of Tat protein translocase
VDVGAPELLIVLAVALLILGPSQLPKVARSIGEAVREFRKVHDEDPNAPAGRDGPGESSR